ncbi:RAMP superfamily CRISPR-associated protein [Helicobacter sp. T3_23-1059]
MDKNFGNYNKRGGNQRNQNHQNKPKGQKTPPPYNFIEPNERVFYPQEFGEVADDKISFTQPFKDSQSGILELTIIAKSDIFTGGFEGKNADKKSPKDFFKIGDKYALSGSSVRGVIRTISQVLSFGKFKTDAPDYKKKGEFVERIKSNFKSNESKLDMTERIFGQIINANGKNFALKSRISFSHFIASKVCRAQYTNPIYISMKPDFEKSKTYKDKQGFRFYAPLGKIEQSKGNQNNDKVSFTISPLGKGTEFEGKLRYFNLTKAELGLVLLCLTSLDSDKGEYYKFGGAKFYGYGDTQIKLNGISEALKNDCINAYKNLLAKTDFELDSRINDLRNASKKQGSRDFLSAKNANQNNSNHNNTSQKPTTHHNAAQKHTQDKLLNKYQQNIDTDDNDDDWNGF